MAPPRNARVPINFDVYYRTPGIDKESISGANNYSNDLDYYQTQDKEAFRQWYDSTVAKDYNKYDWKNLQSRKWMLNDDFEKIWSQVNAAGNEYRGAGDKAEADQANKLDWLKNYLDGGNDGGDGGAGARQAAYIKSLMSSIDESYNRQRGAVDANKVSAAANIQKNADSFKQGLAGNQALYQQGSAAIQAEITRRMAESAARNTESSNQVAAAVGGIGGSASAASAQAAANQASLASSQGYQQDLASRMDQIVAANQRSAENSGELVRQGASGNLENNYNAMINALLAQREQSMMQAQMGGMSSGGGGGGGSKSKPRTMADAQKELDAQTGIEEWIYGVPWSSYFGNNATTQGAQQGAQFLALMEGDQRQQDQARALYGDGMADEYMRRMAQ
jgi:hypothetical protein